MREVKKRSTRISSLALRERILGDHTSSFGVMVPTADGKMEFINIFYGDEQDDFCAMYGCMMDVAENLRANPPSKALSGSSATGTEAAGKADSARNIDEAKKAYERGKQYLTKEFEQMKRAMGLDESQVSDMTGRSYAIVEVTEMPKYPDRSCDDVGSSYYRPLLLLPCAGELVERARQALRELAAEWWEEKIGGYNPYHSEGGWTDDPYQDYMLLIKD